MDIMTAAIVAFSLNYAAYFAEIYRSGIEGIPVGQKEAATVLGFSKLQTFFKIVMPQVIKRILPPMSNEFMTLVKDTSLAQVIGVAELYQLATKNMAREASVIPLIMAGVFYLVMNIIVQQCFNLAERKLRYYR
jgi:polar amino acid transport system permease protein